MTTTGTGRLVVVLVLLVLGSSSRANAQKAASPTTPKADPAYKAPRTEFGDPDLQGIWTNASVTHLERQAPGPLAIPPEDEAQYLAKLKHDFIEKMKSVGGGLPWDFDTYGDYGTKLAVVKGQTRTSWIIDPPDGKIPYSPAGRAHVQERLDAMKRSSGPEDLPLGVRCIIGYGSSGGPPMLNVIYNNYYQIVQTPGYVVILVEMNHDARIIRLGGTHLPASVRPWLGDSIGHWEGDTLVVETTNINPLQNFAGDGFNANLYVSPDSKVTERLTRVGEHEILYEFSVEDPVAYTQTWKAEEQFRMTKGPVLEYACHEGDRSQYNTLAGARATEQKTKPKRRGAR